MENVSPFLRRRFSKEKFEPILFAMMRNMKSQYGNYFEYEVNVISESLYRYMWDYHKISIYDDEVLDEDILDVEDYIRRTYEHKLRDYFFNSQQ